MPLQALVPAGSTFELMFDGDVAYTPIPEVKSVTPSNYTVNETNVTGIASPNVQTKPTLGDPGELQIVLFFNLALAEHLAIVEAIKARKIISYKHTINDDTPTVITGNGWLKDLSFSDNTSEAANEGTLVLRCTDYPVIA